jgi:uncharacterized protein YndB with AHSA1/START domain
MMANIEQTITIAAGPERVWRALTGEIARWWGPEYLRDAERTRGMVIEPQVGGRLMESWGEQGAGYLIGHVVEWLPPQRLACTWMEKEWSGITTFVAIELSPEGENTQVKLLHVGFERLPDGANQRMGFDQGWADLLNRCKVYIEQG